MDRRFELGNVNLKEAIGSAIPLLRDWRGFQPDIRVMDEVLLGVAHTILSRAGNAEDKVRAAADALIEQLPTWKRQKGDDENTVEIRKELDLTNAETLHSRAVTCARLCSEELAGLAYDARHQTAQRLASAWGWASRVTANILERSHRIQDNSA